MFAKKMANINDHVFLSLESLESLQSCLCDTIETGGAGVYCTPIIDVSWQGQKMSETLRKMQKDAETVWNATCGDWDGRLR